MTQIKIVGAVIVVAALIVGGYFTFSHSQTDTKEEVVVSTDSIKTGDKKISFAEFLKTGGSYKCTVNQYVGGMDIVGEAYISDGLIRGEYATQAQGMNIEATIIVRDGYTYTWSSMAPGMGFKARVVEGEDDSKTATAGTYSFNAEQIGDYDCDDWDLDESKFVVPTNITFKEI